MRAGLSRYSDGVLELRISALEVTGEDAREPLAKPGHCGDGDLDAAGALPIDVCFNCHPGPQTVLRKPPSRAAWRAPATMLSVIESPRPDGDGGQQYLALPVIGP